MYDKRYAFILAFGLIVASIMWMGSIQNPVSNVNNPESHTILSEDIYLVENGGFESGSFSPWINQGETSYNQIVSDRVYSGSYALYMDSHLSSTPYEPVYQVFDMSYTLADAHMLSAAIYPTLVGPTCGQAGTDVLSMTINNTVTGLKNYIYYEWSGYTYPGGFVGVNVTSKVMYLLFDIIPNQWNLLERDILSDYSAFFGVPSNASELIILEMSLLSHNSNGDPGDFWIDDIQISGYIPEITTDTSTTPDISTTTTTSDTTTTGSNITLTNTTGDFDSWLVLVISGGSGGVIIIIVIIIILERRGNSGESIPSGYQW